MSFFGELHRRNVVRVGLAYVVIAWVLAQVAEFAFENFGAPDWVLKTFTIVLLLGLPLALIFAWAFELTPEGVKREKDVDRSASITARTGRKLDFLIIGTLVIALAYFVWDRERLQDASEVVAETEAAQTAVADTSGTGGPSPRSIAVLPFVNMSSDQDQEWFSDGLTEEILNALARTPDLLVAARTSSFQYKGENHDVPAIAAALGVAHVLEGSVRRASDRLRVTAQLIRASDGFHLWSETYDRSPDDVIAVQEDIAIEIAIALETAMNPEALAEMVSSGTRSVPAFNAYLEGLSKGIGTLSTGDVYVFLEARDAFERAIALDPNFALAHWELAVFWEIQLRPTNIVSGTMDLPVDEIRANFNTAIENAIRTERDPVNRIRYETFRDAKTLRFDQAIRRNTEYLEQRPNDFSAQNLQLELLATTQRRDELREATDTFFDRDGYNLVLLNNSITFTLASGDPEYITSFARQVRARYPDNVNIAYQAHRAFLWAGEVDAASRLVPLIRSSDLPEDSRMLVTLRQACAEGRLEDAARIYDTLHENYGDDISMAWLSHKLMGQHEDAIATLTPMYEAGDLQRLSNFLSYVQFDARDFPDLAAMLEEQGIQPEDSVQIPYRCGD